MIDVIDALRDLVEPPSSIDSERSVSGLLIDRALDLPIGDFTPETIYAWETACRESPAGTGEVRQDFEVMLLYIAASGGENAFQERSRAVSEALDARRRAWMKLIRLNAHVPPWASGNIQATSDANFVRQFDVRGIAVRVSGYRLVTES